MSAVMDRAAELAGAITAEVGVPATTNPRRVAGYGTQAVVLVGVPDMEPGPIGGGWDLTWRPVVISTHPDPLEAAERVLAAVEALGRWERGFTDVRPATWQADGATAVFAYTMQLTDVLEA